VVIATRDIDCVRHLEWPCRPPAPDPGLPGGGPRPPGAPPLLRRPWRLVAPWWKWEGGDGRGTAPPILKYAGSKAVSTFTRNPQRTLRWQPEDTVFSTRHTTAPLRKLFLPTHDRSYLVTCELHCDAPGFPSAHPEEACQAAFVVRRRAVVLPPDLKELDLLARLAAIDTVETKHALAIKKGGTALQEAVLDLEAAKLSFVAWAQAVGLQGVRQGWFASEHDGIGNWRAVEDAPAPGPGEETVYPLYPLIPDPDAKDHSAAGRAIWFGVVPVQSTDTDGAGSPRFDPDSRYEIRCFVRRHDPRCPRGATVPDCRGEVTWSTATVRWQIAPHFDADGTAHKPVTFMMPDLAELEAQAAPRKASVRLKSPPKSSLEFDVGSDNQPIKIGFAAGICGFSIPLITIVASFVIRLFLPIVIFLFGLFFMLKLKFCIPGGISATLEAQLDAALGATAGGELAAELDAEVALPSATAGLEFEAEVSADAGSGVDA
jgi:hypothetical protein